MKRFILLCAIVGAIIACNKTTTLPSYKAPFASNLSISSLKHTEDTVSVGDTIYLNASGTVYDSLNIYGYFSITSSATGSPVYAVGTSSSPVLLSTVYATKNPTDTNQWSAVIPLTKLTSVSNTKLTITGNFTSQLTLSSMGNKIVTVSDAGQKTKTIYVQ
ncbi:MAG TPA: hypothetical protein VKT28_18390 [Puia sp.]|nr:hypothetical protein [Puia sp.]